ncbi:phage minor tail protein G [Citrobacter freundii]|uniref:Phage minor tail protein G n=1 Tax=Citrobacter freundii TaxID=546 RepID=A0ABY7KUK6_CITFR|nr:phage minor tail protein G [Citrobacter freundii]EIJ9082399.1 phage minor tail protein G [Citrobacter freundii]EJH9545381.1 phage minor tail protein G [Citrobacter freundii]EJO6481251.1 phage minor tail protein G [Citrobacter freundii]EKW5683909.1 phage minor tail protein G [Citrobacter freundii]EKX5705421.1 phage minor tail protein G [Citrobacter freundii]
MFLKSEPFNHNGQTVTLCELSALQRLEHLTWIKAQEEQGGAQASEQQALDALIREGALLVAMSLWHNHELKDALSSSREETDRIQQVVLNSWPVEAISLARNRVARLSGMTGPAHEVPPEPDQNVAEPVTAKKRTKAS